MFFDIYLLSINNWCVHIPCVSCNKNMYPIDPVNQNLVPYFISKEDLYKITVIINFTPVGIARRIKIKVLTNVD